MRVRRLVPVLLAAVLFGSSRATPYAAVEALGKPLDYSAYDGWKTIVSPAISNDGRTLIYQLKPEDGDPSVVIRDLDSGHETVEARASDPRLVAGDTFVLMRVSSATDKRHGLQTARTSLALANVTGGVVQTIDDVTDFTVSADGGTLCFRSNGALTVRDLRGDRTWSLPAVSEYTSSDDGHTVAYLTSESSGNAIGVYDTKSGTTRTLSAGDDTLRRLALSHDGTTTAYLADSSGKPTGTETRLFLAATDGMQPPRAVAIAAAADSRGFVPSSERALTFSDDGRRLFFGTAPVRTPQRAHLNVDIWTTHDDVLQTQQRIDATKELHRTYLAVADIAAANAAQLGSPSLRDIDVPQNAAFAIGYDDRSYRLAQSWIAYSYADAYAVSLVDGRRRLLARRVVPSPGDPVAVIGGLLAPNGRHAIFWDERTNHWFSVATDSGRRVELAPHAATHFEDVDFTEPAPPPPYGIGGWTDDDHVIVYDRYDLWLARLDDGTAVNLTAGAGRRAGIVYSTIAPDGGPPATVAGGALELAGLDWKTFDETFARIPGTGGVPRTVFRAAAVLDGPTRNRYHNRVRPPLLARGADRIIIAQETFRDSRNLYVTDASFRRVERVSDANPQEASYRWGTQSLISYRSRDGYPLRGILIVPDGVRRGSRAPMLIYYYEHYSDFIHANFPPQPGSLPNFARFVSNGYVVLLPDVHQVIGHPGRAGFDSLMPAVDAAIATGLVDPKRIGLSGYSWSGYMTDYVLTKTHRFRAAFAGAARADLIGSYGGIRGSLGVSRENTYEHSQGRMATTPWERPDLYRESSPIFDVRSVTTPYLTIHNDLDGSVPFSFGVEWVTALRRLGKEGYMFSFDGEGHELEKRENQKYWTVALDEWFDYWLKGARRPTWMDGVDFLHRGERDVAPLYGEPAATRL